MKVGLGYFVILMRIVNIVCINKEKIRQYVDLVEENSEMSFLGGGSVVSNAS